MHWQVHCTDVVPEVAGRRSISLVARSKKIMTSQLYVSQISHVAEESRPRAVGLEQWLETGRSSPRAQRETWSTDPRAPIRWSRKNTGLVVEEAVPEHGVRCGRQVPEHDRGV
jgi:hypothetical protein